MKRYTLFQIIRNHVPGQLVIQLTDRCNATCPQCGMRVTQSFRRSTLPADDVKRIIDHAAQKGFRAISFTGGEPLLYLDMLVELIDYAGQAGIDHIRTGTNGFLFRRHRQPGFDARIRRVIEKLASTPLRNFWISIDSAVAAVHERMRGFPNVIAGIQKVLPIFHEHGIYPSANLGINRNIGGEPIRPLPHTRIVCDDHRQVFLNFKHAFRKFYRMAVTMGFTIVNACYPMSVDGEGEKQTELDAVYRANGRNDIVKFSNVEKALLFKALLETVPEFRSRIRIFSPRCSLYSLYRQQLGNQQAARYGCRGGIDFFFVNAGDGQTYPCGFRGNENLGRFWELQTLPAPQDPVCTRCEWECFRDPSELFGPLSELFSHPYRLARRLCTDRMFSRLWASDVLYYRACDYFNGRLAPNFEKLKAFDARQTDSRGAAVGRFGEKPQKIIRPRTEMETNL